MGFGGVKLNAREIKGNRLGNKNNPSPQFATVLNRAPYSLHVRRRCSACRIPKMVGYHLNFAGSMNISKATTYDLNIFYHHPLCKMFLGVVIPSTYLKGHIIHTLSLCQKKRK